MSVRVAEGCVYLFQYPRHNFHGVMGRLENRQIRVESIRDLTIDPIERITFEFQPLLKRGRTLVTGHDLDKDAERSFYLESMIGVRELPKVLPTARSNKRRRSA